MGRFCNGCLLLALYVWVAVVTFGHAWWFMMTMGMADAGELMAGATLSAICWPFYWSAWLWCHA